MFYDGEESSEESIEILIEIFCKNILTKADFLDYKKANEYIQNLSGNDKTILNQYSEYKYKRQIRSIVQKNIYSYLNTYNESNICPPFSFDSGLNYQNYRDNFTIEYKANNNGAMPPEAFNYAFDFIQEASTNYRLFEHYFKVYNTQIIESLDLWAENVLEMTQRKSREVSKEAAKEAAKNASKEAKNQASIAAESAKNAAKKAKDAANKSAKEAVNSRMTEVTQKVSETSVTILGIFSAIVLTIVAGLFYSSSVLNNINSANFLRLICVSSLVGFVCVNLIFVLFHFIEKIKTPNMSKSNSSDSSTSSNLPNFSKASIIDIVVSGILLFIMIITGIFHFIYPDIGSFSNDTHSDTIISGDINVKIDESDSLFETVEPNSTIEQSESPEFNETDKPD